MTQYVHFTEQQKRQASEVDHINNESRRTLAQKMDEKFFRKDSAAKNETDDGVAQACELLKANPHLANLLIGILQAQKAN